MRERGFTVVELMVVLGIVSALVLVGAPYLRDAAIFVGKGEQHPDKNPFSLPVSPKKDK